jgi:acetyl esterase/lipase
MIRRSVGLAVITFLLWVPKVASQTYSTSITAQYRVATNVTYLKSGVWEGKLDVYSRTDGGPYPTVIWIHGGSSIAGTKDNALFSLLPYMEWGWNVVNVEPRLPGVTLAPAAMQNALCALRWVVQNAKEYEFDPEKLVMSGASSGGWFALTTAMAPRTAGWDQPCPGPEPANIAAVVNWYGVADLTDVLEGPNAKDYAPGWVQNLANPTTIAKSVSPLTFVRSSVPPVITIHGDADPTVPYSQSVRLHQALRNAGVTEQLITIPRGLHGGFARAENERAFTAIKAFLAKQGIRGDRSFQ